MPKYSMDKESYNREKVETEKLNVGLSGAEMGQEFMNSISENFNNVVMNTEDAIKSNRYSTESPHSKNKQREKHRDSSMNEQSMPRVGGGQKQVLL